MKTVEIKQQNVKQANTLKVYAKIPLPLVKKLCILANLPENDVIKKLARQNTSRPDEKRTRQESVKSFRYHNQYALVVRFAGKEDFCKP